MLRETEKRDLMLAVADGLDSGIALRELVGDPNLSGRMPEAGRRGIAASLDAGESLTSAFERLGAYSSAELALLAASERSGSLVATCRSLADAIDARRRDRRRFLLGLSYPTLVVLAAGCLLPLPRIVDEGVGGYLALALVVPSVLLGLVLFGLGLRRLSPESSVRAILRSVAFQVPLVGTAACRTSRATFAEVLGTSLRNGLPLPLSLRAAAGASGHPSLAARSEDMLGALQAGSTLADALRSTDAFDKSFIAGVSHGELAGRLEETLERLAVEERGAARRALLLALALAIGCSVVVAVGMAAWGIISGAQSYLEALDEATRVE
ncbi:MAG: type II secretion system F family protein [Myxococcota bacterium]